MILDYGQPQLRGGVYGTFAWGIGYVTVTQIRNAVVEFAHGFWLCTRSNSTAHLRIAVGLNNYANFSKNAGLTDPEVTGHAQAWASMVNGINGDISALGYQRQTDAVAAADIELGWGTATTARRWVDGYDTVNSWGMYDFGDAAGCPPAGSYCSNGWTQDDVYYVSYGAPPAYAVPEIYREDGLQARQWQQISKRATMLQKSKIWFTGTLTQHQACAGRPCTGTNNVPAQGWQQLYDACAADSATAVSGIEYSADIAWL